jgi:hypothetical protein
MVRPSLPRKCKTLGISAPSPGGIQKGPATPKGVAKRKAPAKAKPRVKAQRQQAVAAAAAAPAAPAPAPDAWTQYGDSDGSAILQCWDDLGNAIREYVDVHCVHQPAWNTLETSIKKSLSRVSRRAREYYGFTAGAKSKQPSTISPRALMPLCPVAPFQETVLTLAVLAGHSSV